jgi:hypothetical protein
MPLVLDPLPFIHTAVGVAAVAFTPPVYANPEHFVEHRDFVWYSSQVL